MSELDVVSEYNEDKLLTTDLDNSPFKLPIIKNSYSRATNRIKSDKKKNISPIPLLAQNLSSENSKQQVHINPIKYGNHEDKD